MLLVHRSYIIHQFHELDQRCIHVRATQDRWLDDEKPLIMMKAPSMQMQIKDTTGADDHVGVLKQIMASDLFRSQQQTTCAMMARKHNCFLRLSKTGSLTTAIFLIQVGPAMKYSRNSFLEYRHFFLYHLLHCLLLFLLLPHPCLLCSV